MTDGREDEEKGATEQGQEEVFVSDDEASQADSWQDELPPESDLPPEDDFHDAETLDDDSELSGEESYVEDPAGEDVPEVGAIDKGRGKKILVGALVVGTVFIGGLAYLQFGGNANKSSVAIPMGQVIDLKNISEKPKTAAVMPKTGSQAASAAAPTNGSTDMASLYVGSHADGMANALPSAQDAMASGNKSSLGNSSDMMTLDGPVSAHDGAAVPAATIPGQDKATTDNTASAAKALAPIADTPALPPIPDVPSAATPSPLRPVPTAAVPAQPSLAASAEADARLKALNDQIDSLKKSLDQAAQQNADLTKRLETLQQDQTAANEKAALEGRIKELEQQIATQAAAVPAPVAAKPAAKAAAPAAHRSELDMLADSSMAEPPVAEKEAQVEKAPAVSTKKKRTSVSRKKSRSASRRESGRSSVAASGWVLRAATPDTAWVSMGADAAELRRVTVGETLSGIGKVKEIRQDGEVWTLIGTKGSVH